MNVEKTPKCMSQFLHLDVVSNFLDLLCMWCNHVTPLSFIGSEGSNLTPAHHYGDFRFKTYAPIAFRYFREMFGIRPDDYMVFLITQHVLCSTIFKGLAGE